MAFLLGSFGTTSQIDRVKNLAPAALAKLNFTPTHTIALAHGILYAGQHRKHIRSYNHIFSLPLDGGVILGKLFDRDYNRPFAVQHDVASHLSQNPALLYQNLWGRFIGALYNQTTDQLTLTRDPIGLSTIFYTEQPDGIVFSTDVSLIYAVLEKKPSLDFSYFAEYIINDNQALPSTPFLEIKELLPGMALTINAQGKTDQQCMWDISKLHDSLIIDENDMEERLCATLKASMRAWTSDIDGISVELSGGLDSSATLITLREVLPAGKKLIAVNFIDSKTPSFNEQVHAQEVADMCDVPLHFMDCHGVPLLTELPREWLPNRPTTFLFSYDFTRSLYHFMETQGCYEIVNGQGGDHVFLAPPPINAVADYWLNKGFKGIGKPLKQISAVYRTSWPSVMYKAIKSVAGYYCGTVHKQNISMPFFTQEYVRSLSQHEFYLKNNITHLYPARVTHIQGLSHAVMYADRDQRFEQAVVLHPLLSLPIVELALQIPTYQSFNETHDRIFFRRAASKMKPSKSLWRTLKGETTSTVSKLFAQEADKITDLLMNGTLVKSGIMNNEWLNNELVQMRHGKSDNMWPMLHLIAIQLWLNQWGL